MSHNDDKEADDDECGLEVGLVMSKFGSVRFFTHYCGTVNWTDGPVRALLANRGLNPRFSSNFGPVLVRGSLNREPNLYEFQKSS